MSGRMIQKNIILNLQQEEKKKIFLFFFW